MDALKKDFTKEFKFITSRSGGAGGQNVNKVSSKVELRFDVEASELLTTEEKEVLREKLYNTINSDGILQIVSQEDRSQLVNKQTCIEKFYMLLKKSFTKQKKRRPTKPTRSSVRERLDSKKKASQKKSFRKKNNFDS